MGLAVPGTVVKPVPELGTATQYRETVRRVVLRATEDEDADSVSVM